MPPVRLHPFLPLLVLLTFGGCRAAANLIYEPRADDPLDGYQGSLAEAGINTEMDWGPKQNLLLSEFKTLKESHVQIERRLGDLRAENENLKSQLSGETGQLQKERALRAQAEAETELLRQRRRELEARILSLSIEKAKLEQSSLLAKIDALSATLEQTQTGTTEAAAPPRSR